MSDINAFLLANRICIAANPCVSPDFCLDWPALKAHLADGQAVTRFPHAHTAIAAGVIELVEGPHGDHAWLLRPAAGVRQPGTLLEQGVVLADGTCAFPASWTNLLRLKNLIQEADPGSTIFPTAAPALGRSSLGVGARFTTMHWPAVEWAMAQLHLPLTANQNSIPRELVWDVGQMLAGTLDTVPFPFIGCNVPEGHQGQSVEGMSHGAVLSKLKTGFHRRRIPWGFNADHQPVGGKFDAREQRLAQGCVLATYITFDLSPELAITAKPADPVAWVAAQVPEAVRTRVRARVADAGLQPDDATFAALLAAVWPAMQKMVRRDQAYAAARAAVFTTALGRAYHRELSIDELPGLTTPETLATMLALCEVLDVPVRFVAPAFGFQKNFPFPDDAELERRVAAAWRVCQAFGVSIGFHSGSGKSASNYQVLGKVTGGALEIKTSGRYTYEFGRALAASTAPADQALWRDWHAFTRDLACASAFSQDATERGMARQFIEHALRHERRPTAVFDSPATCAAALAALAPSTEHMFWFEYNFLFVLAADGRADKAALGDHGPAGYAQRARFYAASPEGRLRYLKLVADYLVFLAEHTGLADARRIAAAKAALAATSSVEAFLAAIAPQASAHG